MKKRQNFFPEDKIHLWVCPGILSPDLDHAIDIVALEERDRARRYRFEDDRRRYLGGVLLQRQILARYLNGSSGEISFLRNEWGKPSLDRKHDSAIEFSLSRSHQVALLAVSNGREVGADLESIRGKNGGALHVKDCFCDEEQNYIESAPDSTEAFFQIWARKEAYIKGIGRGLSHPLGEFDVTPAEPTVRDWSLESPRESWQVDTVELPENGYAAAIASPQPFPDVEMMTINCEELLTIALGEME